MRRLRNGMALGTVWALLMYGALFAAVKMNVCLPLASDSVAALVGTAISFCVGLFLGTQTQPDTLAIRCLQSGVFGAFISGGAFAAWQQLHGQLIIPVQHQADIVERLRILLFAAVFSWPSAAGFVVCVVATAWLLRNKSPRMARPSSSVDFAKARLTGRTVVVLTAVGPLLISFAIVPRGITEVPVPNDQWAVVDREAAVFAPNPIQAPAGMRVRERGEVERQGDTVNRDAWRAVHEARVSFLEEHFGDIPRGLLIPKDLMERWPGGGLLVFRATELENLWVYTTYGLSNPKARTLAAKPGVSFPYGTSQTVGCGLEYVIITREYEEWPLHALDSLVRATLSNSYRPRGHPDGLEMGDDGIYLIASTPSDPLPTDLTTPEGKIRLIIMTRITREEFRGSWEAARTRLRETEFGQVSPLLGKG